ncbi:hypothetical protein AAVH_25629 [Aphelenchoides avenae]|nr:hypothetical protein AAVH_25629 [Aphelenchus avenae]
MPGPSRSFSYTQFAAISVITLACAITACQATDPADARTPSVFAGASKTVLALVIFLFGTLGTTSPDSAHGSTPLSETTYDETDQLHAPEVDWEQLTRPAAFDLSLDVPLPTPPPQPPTPPLPSPSPPPSSPQSSLPAASPPPSTSDIPNATLPTPYFTSVLSRYPADTTIFVIFNVYVIIFETTTSAPSWMPTASRHDKRRLSNAIRDASRHHQAVIVINSDLPENAAVSIGQILRQLKAVTELLLPNNLPFLLQANAFAFLSLRSAFPVAVRTSTFAADSIIPAASRLTPDEQLHAALQAVLSAPIFEGYSDEDVATSLSRRAPTPKNNTSGNPPRFNA